MAQRKEIILVCDLCGVEGFGVETHRVAVDAIARVAEACEKCWAGILAGVALFSKAGREPEVKATRAGKALDWPDTPWKFSSHALLRMGERHVTPTAVLRVIADPELKRPGKASDQEIWQKGSTKIVVVPERQVIVTVANGEQEDDDL